MSLSCRTATPADAPRGESPSSATSCATITTPFSGTLCGASDSARHPAIVLFGGSQGGDPMAAFAKDFAAHRFVAASVQYFGAPGTPRTLVDVPVEVAGRVLEALRARNDVDPDRIAVMGTSKGGEYALLVAATYPEVHAVVAVSPTPFAWYGLGENSMPTGCSWSQGGKPLPCVPQSDEGSRQVQGMFAAHEPLVFRTSYDLCRKDQRAVKAALFPLERIRGPVLCVGGGDDLMWNAQAHCDLAMSYLKEHGHPYADRSFIAPGAGHTFLIAQRGPGSAVSSVHFGGYEMRFGGSPVADSAGAAAAWPQIYGFLDAMLARR